MNTPTREALTAASWWADQLLKAQAPLAEQMGAEDNSPMRSPMAAVASVFVQASDRADDPAKVDAFRDALAQRITSEMGRVRYGVTVGVDYHPDRILAAAAHEADLPLGMTSLPWKTTMWVADGSVRVSKGYGADIIDLPLVAS
jgi:hypothetical protein